MPIQLDCWTVGQISDVYETVINQGRSMDATMNSGVCSESDRDHFWA